MKPINYLYPSVLVLRASREQLETLAIEAICACWYYDLAVTLEETIDDDLIRIIEREPCIACE
jgi:hypothetical protein